MSDKIEVTIKDDNQINKLYEFAKIAVVPITVAIFTFYYTNMQKNNELSLKYIELSINILNQPNTENNKNLKEYAIQILDKYSEIPFTTEVSKEMKNLNLFLPGYELDIEEKSNGIWKIIGGMSTTDLSKIAPVPSDTIRWKIKYPFKAIIDKKGYDEFRQQYVSSKIKSYLKEKRLNHDTQYNILGKN